MYFSSLHYITKLPKQKVAWSQSRYNLFTFVQRLCTGTLCTGKSLRHVSCIPYYEFTGHILRNKYVRLCFICIWSIPCKQSKRISSVKSRDIQHFFFFFVRKLKIICFDDLEKVPKQEQIRYIGQNLDWCREHMYYCSEFVILCALNPRRATALRRTRRVGDV